MLKILASTPTLLELVDEMFFEFHIRNPPVKEMVAAEGARLFYQRLFSSKVCFKLSCRPLIVNILILFRGYR